MKPENARRFLVWSLAVDAAFLVALLADVFLYAARFAWPIVALYGLFLLATGSVVFATPRARPGAARPA